MAAHRAGSAVKQATSACGSTKIGVLLTGQAVTMMHGTITTYFEDKGFGFIKDENGDNRYFHVVKVANPELLKKNAAVTFEPTTNNKGLSAYAVKVAVESKYIHIAGERIKITSIKSFNRFTKQVPVEAQIDKENAVLSAGLLMERIRPKQEVEKGATRPLEMLNVTTFQNKTFTFSELEIDIEETMKALKNL